MLVTCPECGYEENRTVKGAVSGYAKVYEVGVKCFKCGTWTHCFYLNERLTRMRQKMDKYAALLRSYPNNSIIKNRAQKAQSQFTKDFAKFNAEFPKRLKKDASITAVTTV